MAGTQANIELEPELKLIGFAREDTNGKQSSAVGLPEEPVLTALEDLLYRARQILQPNSRSLLPKLTDGTRQKYITALSLERSGSASKVIAGPPV
jgi:hypothetical protein